MLPGLLRLLGRCPRYLGFYFGVALHLCGPKTSAFLKLKTFKEFNFHLEMLLGPMHVGPTLVVVTWPGYLAHPLLINTVCALISYVFIISEIM